MSDIDELIELPMCTCSFTHVTHHAECPARRAFKSLQAKVAELTSVPLPEKVEKFVSEIDNCLAVHPEWRIKYMTMLSRAAPMLTQLSRENARLKKRCYPSEVIMIGDTGHYVSEKVAEEITRLRGRLERLGDDKLFVNLTTLAGDESSATVAAFDCAARIEYARDSMEVEG